MNNLIIDCAFWNYSWHFLRFLHMWHDCDLSLNGKQQYRLWGIKLSLIFITLYSEPCFPHRSKCVSGYTLFLIFMWVKRQHNLMLSVHIARFSTSQPCPVSFASHPNLTVMTYNLSKIHENVRTQGWKTRRNKVHCLFKYIKGIFKNFKNTKLIIWEYFRKSNILI